MTEQNQLYEARKDEMQYDILPSFFTNFMGRKIFSRNVMDNVMPRKKSEMEEYLDKVHPING